MVDAPTTLPSASWIGETEIETYKFRLSLVMRTDSKYSTRCPLRIFSRIVGISSARSLGASTEIGRPIISCAV